MKTLRISELYHLSTSFGPTFAAWRFLAGERGFDWRGWFSVEMVVRFGAASKPGREC
jgi:hypothetical protein